jgi:hypothetical protein
VKAMREDETVARSILSVLMDLTSSTSEEAPYPATFEGRLLDEVQKWAEKHCPKDPRFALR